jgi:hypothetical protein
MQHEHEPAPQIQFQTPENQGSPVSTYDAGAPMGIATGYMSREAVEQHAETLVPVPAEMDVADGCGDNREITGESAAYIAEALGPKVLPVEKAFASIFGGPAGKAIAIAAVGISMAETPEAKREFLRNTGGVSGIMGVIQEERQGRSILHSDTGNESTSLHFNVGSDLADKEVGCLYNGKQGEVLHAIAANREVRRAILADLRHTFREEGDTRETHELLGAFTFLFNELKAGQSHTFGRQEYERQISNGALVAILRGEHPSVLDSGLMVSFDLDQVGSPTKSHELGLDPYRSDLGRITLGIGNLLVERNLPTERFMKAAMMLAVAVRGALVSVDQDTRLRGQVEPIYMPLGVIGDPSTAARTIDDEVRRRHSPPGKIFA